MKKQKLSPASPPHPNATVNRGDTTEGVVVVDGKNISLGSEAGLELVIDCVRFYEGNLPEDDIKTKWGISDQEWLGFVTNGALLSAVRNEHERRVFSGECAREAARRHFAKAPDVLNSLLVDEQVAPRHRIEAARELRQAAVSGPDIAPGPKEKFTITINLGSDEKLVQEVYDRPALRINAGDGDPS